MGLRSSITTDKAFQKLKAPPVITKSVFKLKMVGVNCWNCWWGFAMFCEKRFLDSAPPKTPKSVINFKSPKILYTGDFLKYPRYRQRQAVVTLSLYNSGLCSVWVQWCHSLQTDPSAPFCTHAKIISDSLLYLRPESWQPFHFLEDIVAFLSRRRRLVCKCWTCCLKFTWNLASLKSHWHQNAGVGLL